MEPCSIYYETVYHCKTLPHWCYLIKMDLHGYHIHTTWIYIHTTWISHAHHMGITYTLHEYIRTPQGYYIHTTWIYMHTPGYHIHTTWIYMHTTRMSQAHHMDVTSTSHGYHKHSTWMAHAHHMDITWYAIYTPHLHVRGRLQNNNNIDTF